MDVHGMAGRKVYDGGRDDLAVGGDHVNVGTDRPEPLQDRLVRSDLRGLKDGKAAGDGEGLHRARREFPAPSRRSIGLGDDELDGMAGFEERAQGREGGGRTSEEDDPH
jgi:hypothetical protein